MSPLGLFCGGEECHLWRFVEVKSVALWGVVEMEVIGFTEAGCAVNYGPLPFLQNSSKQRLLWTTLHEPIVQEHTFQLCECTVLVLY